MYAVLTGTPASVASASSQMIATHNAMHTTLGQNRVSPCVGRDALRPRDLDDPGGEQPQPAVHAFPSFRGAFQGGHARLTPPPRRTPRRAGRSRPPLTPP